jgi:hypothetical protein
MSKGLRILLVVAVMAGLFVVGGAQVALAQNTQFAAYTSGIQVANLDTATANVTLIGYNPDGTQSGSALPDTIPVNSSKTYFPISNVANGFSGSFVISSDKKVAAISNILSSDFRAGASYVGRSGGATTVLLPLLNKNNSGFTTWYSVQNAGTGDANVNVAYSDGTTASATIKAGAAKVFYQAAETHPGPVFAATITSNQPVVAAVIQESASIMFAYTGFTGGTTNPVFPLINANNSGYVTGLQIQNGGTAATEVTVQYTPGVAGAACTETQTIQPGASNTFAFLAFIRTIAGENCADNARFVGSASVTTNSTNQPLVAVGNQLGTGNGEAYGAFDAAEAGSSVVMPLIMDRNGGFFTGFSVQNVGSAPTTVDCTFSGAGASYKAGTPVTLAPGAAHSDIQFNKIAAGYVGAGTCTSSPASSLVAIVNELSTTPAVDNFLVYEGIAK